jgi:hypothetical protein
MSDFMQGDPDRQNSAVPFSDDDTEREEDAELPATASAEEKLTRLQKKTERIQRLLQEGRGAAAKLKELEEREQRREREIAELRGMAVANQNTLNARQPARDPYEAQLDAIYSQQTDAYNAAQAEIKAGTFTPERQQHYEGIARRIESDKTRVHTERAVQAHAERSRGERGREVWEQKYPAIYQNQRAYNYAEATWNQRKALGEEPTPALLDEVMNDALVRFKLGGKTAPTASDKARMSGMPSAGGGGGGKAGPVAMTGHLAKMAHAAYSDLSETEAEKKWQAKTGKRLRERKVI